MNDEEMNILADMIWAYMHPCEVCSLHKSVDREICEHCN